MAHMVKCSICECNFDRDKIEFVKTSTRRYAHASCYNEKNGQLSEEDSYR